jgi:hypothetical protein
MLEWSMEWSVDWMMKKREDYGLKDDAVEDDAVEYGLEDEDGSRVWIGRCWSRVWIKE